MIIPMDVPLGEQCIQFALALPVGMLMRVFYALCMRFLRRHGYIRDAVFTITSLCLGTLYFFIICDGYPRLYHLFGLALGAYLTHRLAGQLTLYHRSRNEKETIPSDLKSISHCIRTLCAVSFI